MKNIDLTGMSREELEAFAVANSTKVEELERKIEQYEEQFRLLMKKQYGRKGESSEKVEQLSLFNEAELLQQEDAAEPEMAQVHPVRKQKKQKKQKKQTGAKDALLKPLPKETIVYTLSEEEKICPQCGEELAEMKKELRRELQVIPASVKVRETVRYVYSCRHCEKENEKASIVAAPAPEPLFPHCLLSPSLASYVICRKYENRDPLNKISEDFRRQGLRLSRQTLSNWVVRVAEDYGERLYERMREELVKAYRIYCDETPVQVLKEPERSAEQKSYMWVFSNGDEAKRVRLYRYAPSRAHTVLTSFLGTYEGYVQSDGHSAYKALCRTHKGITLVGCMAHVRRKYLEAVEAQPKATVKRNRGAAKGLRYCNVLMKLDARRKKLAQSEWKRYKDERIAPILEAFFAWAEEESVLVAEGSKLEGALKYTRNQRKELEHYLEDGRLEMSNNEAERTVKPFVMGRKCWMFCNTPKGATASAILYSLVETAKANGLKPYEYLQWVLEQMRGGAYRTDCELDCLMPWSEKVPPDCRVVETGSERQNLPEA